MPAVISFVSTKRGVGKTTVAANLGGLLAAFGLKVLAIDADVQPSLSKFFPVHYRSPRGLSAVVTPGGNPSADCISRTIFSNLDLVYSDTPDAGLQAWLNRREDRLMILRRAMQSPLMEAYDVVLIDTQGAVGELQKSAAMAANIMVSPVKPDALSAGEFATGRIAMLDELNRLADFGESFRSGDLLALINAHERTTNARALSAVLRQQFADHAKVRILDTVIPSAAAYCAAATARIPVHDFDRRRQFDNSAWNVMHRLAWELFPSLANVYAGAPRRTLVDVGTDDEGTGDGGKGGGRMSASGKSLIRAREDSAQRLDVAPPGAQAPDRQLTSVIRLRITDVMVYERNPRRASHERIAELKESIRANGIEQIVTVTRRPGETRYVIAKGGNSRVTAAMVLYDETGDERFLHYDFVYVPYPGEARLLAAHLRENDQRADLCFWDKANGYLALKADLETERGSTL